MKPLGKAILLGCATAVVIGVVLLTGSMWLTMQENKVIHTTNIKIAGKICNDEILGTTVSKIQGPDGGVYFIPNSDCNLYPIDGSGSIFYNRVCNLPVKDPGPLDGYCFNRTVGDYP